MPETKSSSPRAGPVMAWRPQTSASGATVTPELRRPDGGSANGVSLSSRPNTQASTRPSTNTGMDTPRLANIIVPTSAGELRR